jgi:xanthine/CO dehydrogenase XdhC/CoxF family maturation factor
LRATIKVSIPTVRKRFESGESELEVTPEGEIFLHAMVPPARVLIIGATHIGQLLAQLVTMAGYEVVVIDPRTAFAAASRFPRHSPRYRLAAGRDPEDRA